MGSSSFRWSGDCSTRAQLLPPERTRLEATIAAYSTAPNIAAELCLVTDQTAGKTIQAAAAKLGLSVATRVQRAQFGPNAPAEIAQ